MIIFLVKRKVIITFLIKREPFMKEILSLLIILMLSACSEGFSYQEYLNNYNPDSTEFMEVVDLSILTSEESEMLVKLDSIHGDTSLFSSHSAFFLYLYHRSYGLSYVNDQNYERRERFAKDFLNWKRKTIQK